jgi:Ca2+-binding EF-hand superfamily protein
MRKTSATLMALATGFALSSCASLPDTSATQDTSTKAEKPADPKILADDLFDKMDLNGDGFLSREEMAAGLRHYTMAGEPASNPNVMFGLKDGTKAAKSKTRKAKPMSEAEIQRTVDQAFSSQDVNFDKRISKDEFKKMVFEKQDTSAPWQDLL